MGLAFILGICSTVIAVLLALFFWKDQLELPNQHAAMVTGVYTGGTINMNAIGLALTVPTKLYLDLNSFDILLSGIYFIALLSFAQKFFSTILPKTPSSQNQHEEVKLTVLSSKKKINAIILVLLVSILIMLTTLGLSFLFFKKLNPIFIVLSISLISSALSLNRKIRSIPFSFQVADYLLLVFSVSIGLLADFNKFSVLDISTFGFISTVFVIMLVTHLTFARLFRIDVDTFAISSTATVFGPPFIGPVAIAFHNKSLIAGGILCGIIGNLLGTYLGLLIYWSLQ